MKLLAPSDPVAADPFPVAAAPPNAERLRAGFLWGFVGVLAFSFTLPATRVAAPEFGGTVVGLGRAVIAALLAAGLLVVLKERPPERRYWGSLVTIAAGVVVGFPLLTAYALQQVPAAHGAVVVGLLPALTAVMAVLRGGERPPRAFWFAVAAGVVAVFVFAAVQGAGQPQFADLLLLCAVASAAVGYAEGGRLARDLGGWRVICWALIISAPVLIIPVALAVAQQHGLHASPRAWLGLAYVSVISMFLGFFAWYRGLALGGIARVGQIQLVQPVMTMAWAALFLGEVIDLPTALAGLLVVASVALTRLSWRQGSATGR
ncbi:MAG: DMT family transporter [Thermomicrobiales bacterium]|nr:DMT family transporter [Thermomicrobiales bacterium]